MVTEDGTVLLLHVFGFSLGADGSIVSRRFIPCGHFFFAVSCATALAATVVDRVTGDDTAGILESSSLEIRIELRIISIERHADYMFLC